MRRCICLALLFAIAVTANGQPPMPLPKPKPVLIEFGGGSIAAFRGQADHEGLKTPTCKALLLVGEPYGGGGATWWRERQKMPFPSATLEEGVMQVKIVYPDDKVRRTEQFLVVADPTARLKIEFKAEGTAKWIETILVPNKKFKLGINARLSEDNAGKPSILGGVHYTYSGVEKRYHSLTIRTRGLLRVTEMKD